MPGPFSTRNDDHKCKGRLLICVSRSRFYLSLAQLGKTPLESDERALLQSELVQARRRHRHNRNSNSTNSNSTTTTTIQLRNYPLQHPVPGVPNNVFLFDSSQGKEEYFYKALARFLHIDRAMLPPLDEKTYISGHGLNDASRHEEQQLLQQDTTSSAVDSNSNSSAVNSNSNSSAVNSKSEVLFDICNPSFDYVRKELLPISYTLSRWLLEYLVPAARNRTGTGTGNDHHPEHEPDLVIPNLDRFASIVEGFARDPCDDRLVRNDVDGEYY